MTKSMLVILAGGYGTRLGNYPKQYIKNAKGNYLFEEIINACPAEYVTIITNQAYHIWWVNYIKEPKYARNYNLLVEPHWKPDEAYGPLKYLTSQIPLFAHIITDLYISPVDCYFDNYDFFKKLSRVDNGIVVSRYPEKYMKQMGVCIVNKNKVEKLYEKQYIPKQGFFDKRWIFTGIMKITMATLLKIGNLDKKNLGELIITCLEKGIDLSAIKYKGLYRDVGNLEVFKELNQKHKIMSLQLPK